MPKEYQSATKIEKCSEVFCMILPSDNEAAEVVEPGEKPLNLPTSFVSAEGSPVLRFSDPGATIGRDHFNSVMLIERLIERIAVVGLVADEPVRVARYPEAIESVFDQSHFSRRSAFCPSGDRKTIAVNDCHDLGSFAPLGLPDLVPPFFAETKVPSMKHSSRLSPPRSRRSSARATRRSSKNPSSLHR